MGRQNVIRQSESGPELVGWFDPDKAEVFEEAVTWDGHNHISVPTGSQWTHEELVRTASGAWVLHSWSQRQGSVPGWAFIETSQAREWLLLNEHEGAVERHFGPAEEERRPGPARVGTAINVRLPDDMLAEIDRRAGTSRSTRAATIRAACESYLSRREELPGTGKDGG